jgi:hypothetical protein
MIRGPALQQPHRRSGHPLLHEEVVQKVGLAGALQLGQSGAVPHEVADRDPGLAVGAERRPVLGDGRVVVDESAVDEPVDDGGRHALGCGEHHGPRVRGPVPPTATVGPSGPHVDDGLAVEVDGERSAAKSTHEKQLGEGSNGTGEIGIRRATDGVR